MEWFIWMYRPTAIVIASTIFILYLDDSGSVKNPRERHFVLAGIAVYERQAYHLISRADSFVSSLNLASQSS